MKTNTSIDGQGLAASVIYLLDNEPLAVRVHEGGCAEENLGASLAITMQRMRGANSELLDAANRLLATFDELKATTQAERIITAQSMTDLRRRSEQAIADLRAAAAKAEPHP